jgi:hypothetical protein
MNGLTDMLWTLFRIVLGVLGSAAILGALVGIVGILRGGNALSGAKDMAEFVKWHWSDEDQAAAALRTRSHLLAVVFCSGLAALSFAIFGRQFEAVTLQAWCVSLFGVAFWWWLEREFAWPGWFVPREARGTRGLFFVRRDARRSARQGDGGDGAATNGRS